MIEYALILVDNSGGSDYCSDRRADLSKRECIPKDMRSGAERTNRERFGCYAACDRGGFNSEKYGADNGTYGRVIR